MSNFPKEMFRGVTVREQLNDDLTARASLFNFDEKHADIQRPDNYDEESINWNDDNNALSFTFCQTKPGSDKYQFIGIVTIHRKKIDYICKLPTIKGALNYERKSIDGNPYHGNLLLSKDISKPARNSIKGTIAVHCEPAILRDLHAEPIKAYGQADKKLREGQGRQFIQFLKALFCKIFSNQKIN
jgi:hypothetical protein